MTMLQIVVLGASARVACGHQELSSLLTISKRQSLLTMMSEEGRELDELEVRSLSDEVTSCDLYMWTDKGKEVFSSNHIFLNVSQFEDLKASGVEENVDLGYLSCVNMDENGLLQFGNEQVVRMDTPDVTYSSLGRGVCRRGDGTKEYEEVYVSSRPACELACNADTSCVALAFATGQDRCFHYSSGTYDRTEGKKSQAECLVAAQQVNPAIVSFTKQSRVFVPYGSGQGFGFGMGAVEQGAYDAVEKYMYTISEQGFVNVIDYESPNSPQVLSAMALALNGKATDAEICHSPNGPGLLIVAVGADDVVSNGKVRIFNTIKRNDPKPPTMLKEYEVGPLPDMVKANRDCTLLAVANEGEGAIINGKLVDPEGSVHIIDLADEVSMHVKFDPVARSDEELIAKGVNLALPLSALEYWDEHSAIADAVDFGDARQQYTPATNLEPEYLGWSADGSKVFVNLQENNAIITVNVPPRNTWGQNPPSAVRIDALGLKDWTVDGGTDGLDLIKDDACELKNFDGFYSLRLPDSIDVTSVDGVDYIITANEGDDKEYGDYEEKWKAKELFEAMNATDEVKAQFEALKLAGGDEKSGITAGTAAVDYSNPERPVLQKMVSFGGRGISIFKATSSGLELIWDSGSAFEQEICKAYPWAHNAIQDEEFAIINGVLYNSSEGIRETLEEMNDPLEDGCQDRGDGVPGACPMGGTTDERSPKDGAAPEAIVTGHACGRHLLVTATEKQDVALVYDITNIAQPELLFVKHLSPISESMNPDLAYTDRTLGEIDPEFQLFVTEDESPTGKAGVFFGGAWSGTMSFWELECNQR